MIKFSDQQKQNSKGNNKQITDTYYNCVYTYDRPKLKPVGFDKEFHQDRLLVGLLK